MPSEESVCNEAPMAKRKKKTRAEELLDELIKEYGGSEGVTGPDGLLKDLTRAVVHRAIDAEITHHLGYEARGAAPEGQSNRRNGKNGKTVRTNQGPLAIEVPRDRDGSFEPKIVPKHKRHFDGFDDKIVSRTTKPSERSF